MKPEALFLAHRIPYPPDKGDKIRSWRILKHLTGRFRVHLACFVDDSRDFQHQSFLEGMCESVTFIPLNPAKARLRSLKGIVTGAPLSFEYFQDRKMAKRIREIRARPLKAEIVFSSSMAPYIETPFEGRKRIVDFCDADSEKWRSYAESTKSMMAPIYGREAKLLARRETEIAARANASFAVSADEAAVFNARPNMARPVGWFQNGVDTDFFAPTTAAETPSHDCIFTGAMDYRANVEGVLCFMKEVWPLVRQLRPNASFAIVGANPAPAILALDGHDGVTVTGRVDDIRPWLTQARIAVAPLQIARGVQNKVLEAMAMEKAIVVSPEAMTGIDAPGNAAVIAYKPNSMAEKILQLLDNEEERKNLGETARRYVLEHHQWAITLMRFDTALDELGL